MRKLTAGSNRLIAVAATAVAALSVTTISATASPSLSKRQVQSLATACHYFPSDYAGIVGELKMANLTGRDFTSAARYVRKDLRAVAPMLGRAQRSQLARARAVLTPVAARNPKRPVTMAEKARLGKRFGSAPFATLNQTVYGACQNFAKYRKSH